MRRRSSRGRKVRGRKGFSRRRKSSGSRRRSSSPRRIGYRM